MTRWFSVVGALSVATLALGVWLAQRSGTTIDQPPAMANAVSVGRNLYMQHCASCHGVNLEGQENWRRRLPSGRLPAPPHDASGHTWHHPDDILIQITREGPATVAGNGYESDMPGFGGILSDAEIRRIIAFIKTSWPERQRQQQEQISRPSSDAIRR